MLTPANVPEVEAAHIIPRGGGENGSNDPRNGLALCRSHHWAFDRLLWAVTNDCRIAVPKRVKQVSANDLLAKISGTPLRAPKDPSLRPATAAADHHRNRVIEAWGAF
jgi:putative restriction endonuclease